MSGEKENGHWSTEIDEFDINIDHVVYLRELCLDVGMVMVGFGRYDRVSKWMGREMM